VQPLAATNKNLYNSLPRSTLLKIFTLRVEVAVE
jgi:hypothetical protein